MTETLINLLEEIDDEIDWEYESRLVDDRILDSLTVITMIADLENSFDVEIRAEEITPDNFNSADAIWKMICRLREN